MSPFHLFGCLGASWFSSFLDAGEDYSLQRIISRLDPNWEKDGLVGAKARLIPLSLLTRSLNSFAVSHPFPQKTRKWMGHGHSILGPDQYWPG
jgi:hypothetical protein